MSLCSGTLGRSRGRTVKGKVRGEVKWKSRIMSLHVFHMTTFSRNTARINAGLTDLPRWPGLDLSSHARHRCVMYPELSFTPSELHKAG